MQQSHSDKKFWPIRLSSTIQMRVSSNLCTANGLFRCCQFSSSSRQITSQVSWIWTKIIATWKFFLTSHRISQNREQGDHRYSILNNQLECHPSFGNGHLLMTNCSFKVKFPLSSQIPKQTILSTIARLFDSLGWLNPLFTEAKLFLNRKWEHNLDWDDDLSTLYENRMERNSRSTETH